MFLWAPSYAVPLHSNSSGVVDYKENEGVAKQEEERKSSALACLSSIQTITSTEKKEIRISLVQNYFCWNYQMWNVCMCPYMFACFVWRRLCALVTDVNKEKE